MVVRETGGVQSDAGGEGGFAPPDHDAPGVGSGRIERVVARLRPRALGGAEPEVLRRSDALRRHDAEMAGAGGAEQVLRLPPGELGKGLLREDDDVAPELQREERFSLAEELGGARSDFGLAGDEEAVAGPDQGIAVRHHEAVFPIDPGDQPLPGAEIAQAHIHCRRSRQDLDFADLAASETE